VEARACAIGGTVVRVTGLTGDVTLSGGQANADRSCVGRWGRARPAGSAGCNGVSRCAALA